jgi:hypothetical protein
VAYIENTKRGRHPGPHFGQLVYTLHCVHRVRINGKEKEYEEVRQQNRKAIIKSRDLSADRWSARFFSLQFANCNLKMDLPCKSNDLFSSRLSASLRVHISAIQFVETALGVPKQPGKTHFFRKITQTNLQDITHTITAQRQGPMDLAAPAARQNGQPQPPSGETPLRSRGTAPHERNFTSLEGW